MVGRTAIVVVLGVVLLGTAVAPGVAVNDEFPEKCANAPVVDPGTITGSLDTPDDVDVFRIDVAEADYLAIKATAPAAEQELAIFHAPIGAETSLSSFNPGSARHEYRNHGIVTQFSGQGVRMPVSYKAFAEESGTMCLGVYELSSRAEFPYQYTFRIARNSEPTWWTDAQQLAPEPGTPHVLLAEEYESVPTPDLQVATPTPTTGQSPTPTKAATPTATAPATPTTDSQPPASTPTAEQSTTDDSSSNPSTPTAGAGGPGFGLFAVVAAMGALLGAWRLK